MTQQPLENVRVGAFDLMPSPEEIHARVPLSEKASDSVFVLVEIILFVNLLLVGFVYVWRRGALNWR